MKNRAFSLGSVFRILHSDVEFLRDCKSRKRLQEQNETLRDCKCRNLSAARVWEAFFELDHPAQVRRSDPLICRYLDKAARCRLLMRILSTFHMLEHEKTWISLERIWYVVINFTSDYGFFYISNSTSCLLCTIGSISHWISCFSEATNLNQEEQQPNEALNCP